MKEYYSVAELLELNFGDLPKTRKGLDKYLAREDWAYREVPSRGKTGLKKEYLLPDFFRNLMVLKNTENHIISTQKEEPFFLEKFDQKSNSLTNAQKEVAAHKLIIVRYLEQMIKKGQKKTRVIQQFVDDANSQNLPSELLEAVNKANAKAGTDRTVSRRSLFEWMKAVDDAEKHGIAVLSVLAPKRLALIASCSKGIAEITKASVNQKKWQLEVQDKVEKAAKAVEKIAKKGGLSDKTATEIRKQILGIADS